jgi:crossover junction endodeoxyribonuclease RusA
VSAVEWVSDTMRRYKGVRFPWRGIEDMEAQMSAIDRAEANTIVLKGDRLAHHDFYPELKASKALTSLNAERTTVEFDVQGIPRPQGSHRSPAAGVVINDNPKLAEWRRAVAVACPRERIEGPIAVEAEFRLPRPVSVPKSRAFPAVKPDLDKLLRGLFDGITDGKLWEDDARVVRVTASKRYALRDEYPGVRVRVSGGEG